MISALAEFKGVVLGDVFHLTHVVANQIGQDVHHQEENPKRQGC